MFPDGLETALTRAGVDPSDDTLDRATLAALSDEFGASLLGDIAASFRAEAEGALGALDAALAAGDPTAAERQFHFIKGSALYLALARLAGLCDRLEAEARMGLRHGPETAAALRAEIDRGLALLSRLGIGPRR